MSADCKSCEARAAAEVAARPALGDPDGKRALYVTRGGRETLLYVVDVGGADASLARARAGHARFLHETRCEAEAAS